MRRILCVGGHDFTARPEDRALTDLIASLAGGEGRRVCLLPTASGDAAEHSGRFFSAFSNRGCVPSEVSLFRLGKRPVALRDHLLSQDLIYVGGGSMLNLLAVWDAHDLGAILRLAWERGILICGQSAGAMCWFEVGISKGSGKARRAAGLGVLPGSCCVHYHSELDRRQLLLESVASSGQRLRHRRSRGTSLDQPDCRRCLLGPPRGDCLQGRAGRRSGRGGPACTDRGRFAGRRLWGAFRHRRVPARPHDRWPPRCRKPLRRSLRHSLRAASATGFAPGPAVQPARRPHIHGGESLAEHFGQPSNGIEPTPSYRDG